jgi:hypothetical protein
MPEMRILEPTASAHVQALRDTRQAERSGSRQPRRLGDLLPPSPPAEKATARCDQPRQSSTGDRRGNAHGAKQPVHLAVDAIGEEKRVVGLPLLPRVPKPRDQRPPGVLPTPTLIGIVPRNVPLSGSKALISLAIKLKLPTNRSPLAVA